MRVEVKEVAKVKLKNPVIIEGFPGVGMLGTISATYLAETLDMKLIGYFTSSKFPPIASIHEYAPSFPARIYASEKLNVIVLFSEFVIPSDAVYMLSQKILELARKHKASAIYSIAGIGAENPDTKIYGIASTKELSKKLESAGVTLIKEGATQGVSGILIAECAAEGFPAANVMAQTSQPLDPTASAKLLELVSKITGVKVDTTKLRNEGNEIQSKLKSSIDKIKSMHENYNEMQDNPMYG
ncbi:MAG: PAC2 family protein [Candidatus Micrarchaeia archaeon]|jgi:uncharacterized protein